MRKSLLLSIVAMVVSVVAVAFAASTRLNYEAHAKSVAPTGATRVMPADRVDESDAMTNGLFRTIAKRQNPIVVAITTQSRVTAPAETQFSGGDDFFWRFFGGPRAPREQIRRALGSGFLISSNEIVTNNHVVAGADQIRVALFGDDRKTYPAEIVGRDPLTDSALIRLKGGPGNLPAATLGDSNALEPGDWVMAIGNPFQLGHTVTVGVISYKGRPFATTGGRFQNMLQTDASINPGNSGGPLINVRGEVIGVNSAILSGDGNGGNIGIGFAVPIDTVKDLLPQLREGTVHRGQLGVQILSTPITDDEAKSLGLPKPEGAIVSRVEPGSPADRAGLRAGDVIVEYDSKPVPDADHLTALVVATRAGSRVPIGFYRDGHRQTTTATVEALNLEDNDQSDRRSDLGSAPGFGLSLGDVTPEVANQLRLPAGTQGAVVENVEPFTPAANGGVRRGDVILQVDRGAVHSAREAARALGGIKSGQPVFLLLSRQGVQLFVELKKE
jgi:serine protease Do